MEILLPLILIVGGLVAIFYIRPKTANSVVEIKYMQTKKISDLLNMFNQMDENGLGNDYREYVELKGQIVSENLTKTPFSEKDVAYCKSKVIQVTEVKNQVSDTNGNIHTNINKTEIPISEETSSQDIALKDDSSNEEVILEINAIGCKLDLPKTFDRFEPKSNLGRYRYFNSFSFNRFGAETLGFRMTEETISANQNLYVIGEAFKVGNTLHIGKPQDDKKPFIVTTRSEEDMINKSNQTMLISLIGGIAAIFIGIVLLVSKVL